MLSYQHAFHAGNAADVHKHALLAAALHYLARKDKPLFYMETHAGRGLYDLRAPAALKTGEARAGVERLLARFPPDHPYVTLLTQVRADHGAGAYPGSPLLAARLLRPMDRIELAELHPAEHAALVGAAAPFPNVRVHRRDGLEMARAVLPPMPRRGLVLIDPSWEVRDEYARMAALLPRLHRLWGVGVLMLWYPILRDRRHEPMLAALRAALPAAMVHEVRFPPARAGHGMEGSGMLVVNAPWGLAEEAAAIDAAFGEG